MTINSRMNTECDVDLKHLIGPHNSGLSQVSSCKFWIRNMEENTFLREQGGGPQSDSELRRVTAAYISNGFIV